MAHPVVGDQLLAALRAMSDLADPIPRERRELAHLYVLARPIGAAADIAQQLLIGTALRALIQTAALGEQIWFPNLAELSQIVHYPSQVVASTPSRTRTGPEREMLQLSVGAAGEFALISGQASRRVRGNEGAVVAPQQLADLLHQLLAVIAAAARDSLEFDGDWQVGLRIDGLAGVLPIDVVEPDTYLWQRFSPYPRDAFEQLTTMTGRDLQDSRPRVVQRLLADLTRSLGVAPVS
jgi:hypothetical protein